MDYFADFIRVLILSIIEGVTEFLPVSSTGHLLLANRFVALEPESFSNAFMIIIQLGAILSVVVIYFHRLNPFAKSEDPHHKQKTFSIWLKMIVAVLPAIVLGLLGADDVLDRYFFNPLAIALTLFIYGVAIVWIEKNPRQAKITSVHEIPLKIAFCIGLFQCLAMIPGTSRSAATILGAMLLGVSRAGAADFSFFVAVPTMIGATALKVVKKLGVFSVQQWILTGIGFVLSFLVAYIVVRLFLSYIKKHDFRVFGYYRIVLAIVVLLYFGATGSLWSAHSI